MLSRLRKIKDQLGIGIFRTVPVLASGILRFSKQPGRILIVGRKEFIDFYSSFLLEEVEEQEELSKHYFWQIHRAIRKNSHDVLLSLVEGTEETTSCYQTSQYHQFIVPNWLSGLAKCKMTTITSSLKSDRSRVKRNQLWFHVSRDLSEVQAFYHEMYIPYVQLRHKGATVEMCLKALISGTKKGHIEVLFVMFEQTAIAGAVLDYSDGIPRIWSIGIRNGERAWMDMGSVAACYFFAGKWLSLHGFHRMGLGLCRPFLSDGIFKYKLKLGNHAFHKTNDGFLFTSYMNVEQENRFLEVHPFIHHENGCLQVLTAPSYRPPKRELLRRIGLSNHRVGMGGPEQKWNNASLSREALHQDFTPAQLERACKNFLQSNCLGYLKKNILFYSEEGHDKQLSKALLSACDALGIQASWYCLNTDVPLSQTEKELLSHYQSTKARVVIEVSNQYFYPSIVWQTMRNQKTKLLAIGNLSARQFIACVDQFDAFLVSRLEHAVAALLLKANEVRIQCESGTDITMQMQRSIREKVQAKLKLIPTQYSHVLQSQGYLSIQNNQAFLSGQVSFLGLPRTINGTFVCQDFIWPPNHFGPINSKVTAIVQSGTIVDMIGNQEIIDALFERNPLTNRAIKHFCIGLLPSADCSRGLMTAERSFGAITMGYGDYPHHSDWVTKNASIYLDSVPIIKKGELVHDELQMHYEQLFL